MKMLLCLAFVFLTVAVDAAASAQPVPGDFVGVWQAKRRLGPELYGPLTIVERSGAWTAWIAGHSAPVTFERERLSFEIAGNRGSFAGGLASDGASIVGHWYQPSGAMLGYGFASPVTLVRAAPRQWRGDVEVLDDTATLYLVVKANADGSLGAFLRNPERNLGVFGGERLIVRGSAVALTSPGPDGKGEREILAGTYRAQTDTLSFYWPQRGGTFDFTRMGDDPANDFFPRGKTPAPYVYRPPLPRDDGWPVATLEDVGIAREGIARLIQKVIDTSDDSVQTLRLHGALIARHGKLVLEEYFHGYSADQPHETRSASKSLTAVLTGAAIEGGLSLKTSTPVYPVMLGGDVPAELDPRKQRMTVEHLLTMTSGYYCDDSDSKAPGNEEIMQDQTEEPDWYRYTLNVPMAYEPGEKAVYCSSNPHLLGGVISRATGTPLPDLFRDLIARPLQINRYHLNLSPTNEPYMGGGIYWLPRDFMKLGQSMLNGGTWNGKRIVSREWAARSIAPLVEMRGLRYGYLWWVTDYPYQGRQVRAFFAGGNGGQVVVGVPELDLVVAFFAGNYSSRATLIPQREFVPNYVLPAVDATK